MRRDGSWSWGKCVNIVALGGCLYVVSLGEIGWASAETPTRTQTEKPRAAGGTQSSLKPAGQAAIVGDDLDASPSALRALIERYTLDRGALDRSYPIRISATRRTRLRRLYTDWLDRLAQLDFEAMDVGSRADYLLFKNHLEYEIQQLDFESKQSAEAAPLLPFAQTIVELEESRRRMEPIDARAAATALTHLAKQIAEIEARVEAGIGGESAAADKSKAKVEPLKAKKTVANRAIATLLSLRNTLKQWFEFYDGYDPTFTWWVSEPHKTMDKKLAAYAALLSEKVLGVKLEAETAEAGGASQDDEDDEGRPVAGREGPPRERRAALPAKPGEASDIVGDPIGREALAIELAHAMIPYTPEELIAIGRKELAWCEAEMVKASRELGYGDDWRKALEHVKTLYVEPGKQPQLIRDLALEAVKFLDDHDLITIPPLARESWRMEMMSPARQLVNPFFTGGETIRVSYPTGTMSHEQKLMSMRGNNIYFSRATVHHELIPGHHLQQFMTARYKPYRRLFRTPFWTEGWALYWELLLWDLGFGKSPEDRIGMLFWRMHRAARIIFSLSFHLEQMTPQQCIDFLVERVGHERENATAEVRRSFTRAAPLYQAAYLLGGLQIRALHRELVASGKMTPRAFHDAILRENHMPIEMLRAILTQQRLSRDFKASWRFYDLDTQ